MSISSEITRIKTNIANAYSTLETKGATMPTTLNSSNLVQAINSISAGIDINGIIEEYTVASSGNVSAGDFVEFVNEANNTPTNTVGSTLSTKTGSGEQISAVALSDTKIFIAYRSSTNLYMYGMVCTISGTTITKGTETKLSSVLHTGYSISVSLLDRNTVFIAHSSGSGYYLYAMICTINGTTITAGTDTILKLSSTCPPALDISTVLYKDSKIFIAYSWGADELDGLISGSGSKKVQTVTSTDNIIGIAKTNATSGQTVQVVMPDV